MERKLLILCGIVLLVAFIFILWKTLWSRTDEEPVPSIPENEQMVVRGVSEPVTVRDVTLPPRNNPAEKPNVIDQQGDVLMKQAPSYDILYFSGDQSFLITLKDQNLQAARDAAEADLLQRLQVGRKEACKVQVIVGVPYDVSPQASGQDYNLSFCPDGIPLPR